MKKPVARIQVTLDDLRKDGTMRVTRGVVQDLTDHLRASLVSYMEANDLSAAEVDVDSSYNYEVVSARTTATRRRTG